MSGPGRRRAETGVRKVKKLAAALLVLLIPAVLLFAYDPRLTAMGGIGVGVSGTEMLSYVNPAAVFFDDNPYTFALSASMADVVGKDPWPCNPSTSLEALFTANLVTAGIDISYNAVNRRENARVDVVQDVRLDVNVSAGYGIFSAGVGVTGGSQMQRLDVPMDEMGDLLVQTLFAPFDRVVNSEYIQLRAGMMVRLGQFHIGVLLDNLLQKTDSGMSFKWDSIFNGTGTGFYWSSPEYSARGRMNNFVFSAGAEVRNIFKASERTLSAGAEVRFRFTRTSGVSIRGGYTSILRTLGSGTVTAGAGAEFPHFSVALNADFPIGGNPVLRATVLALI